MRLLQTLLAALEAGFPLELALGELARSSSGSFRTVVHGIERHLRTGTGLAAGLQASPSWFDASTVALVTAGEATGTLAAALTQALSQLATLQRVRRQLLPAALYASYLAAAAILGGALLDVARSSLTAGGVDAFGGSLVGALAVHLLWACGIAGMAFLVPIAFAVPGLGPLREFVRLRLPASGWSALAASRFCRTFAMSLGAGLEVGRSLELALAATGSERLERYARLGAHALRTGAPLLGVLSRLELLDSVALQQLATAERVGELPRVLTEISEERLGAAAHALLWSLRIALAIVAAGAACLAVAKVFALAGAYGAQLSSG